METNYDQNWFKDRAFNSIKRIDGNSWDYSDSLLLYISDQGSDLYEEIQEEGSVYFKLITQPERDYLKLIAKNIVDLLPAKFEYIDLGPGTEHKEQFIFDEAKRQGKEFIYRPVDINQHFLGIAQKHAEAQEILSKPILSSFEDLSSKLTDSTLPRFVSLGLTFQNYSPQVILKLLFEIAGLNGFIFINSQIRDRVDMKELEKAYSQDSVHLADDKLRLIGLEPGEDVSIPIANEDVRSWCTVKNVNDDIAKLGIKNGDRLLVFQSLRYTKESLNNELNKSGAEYETFDLGSSFIGSILKT